MSKFEEDLKNILKNDPLDILNIKASSLSPISNDERLINSFEDINKFIKKNGREPQENHGITERQLSSRLEGIRKNPEKIKYLKPYDKLNLLKDYEIKNIDDILKNDTHGLLDEEGTDNNIFNIENIPKTREQPDYYTKRMPCKDFEKFEPLFRKCQLDLMQGNRQIRPFRKEQQIEKGQFFILNSIMAYVAEADIKEKMKGRPNARLRCIFDNGTESNMLLRSLATGLYRDKSGKRITEHKDKLLNYGDEQLESHSIVDEDKKAGFIYIAKSKSEKPEIKEIKNLYKIGFSIKPAKERIKNAKREPSYLMADVDIVSEFECFNMNTQKLELLLHRFFAKSCLSIDIFDSQGRRHMPREWFIVPMPVIEEAIHLLIKQEIIHYQYDEKTQQITHKEK